MRHGVWAVEEERPALVFLDELDRLGRVSICQRRLIDGLLDDLQVSSDLIVVDVVFLELPDFVQIMYRTY